MISSPASSASVSLRPWVSTTPTTTSMPSFSLRARLMQHLVGLADAGRRAEEDLEPAAAFLALGRLEQRIGRGALFEVAPLICHEALGS